MQPGIKGGHLANIVGGAGGVEVEFSTAFFRKSQMPGHGNKRTDDWLLV